MSSNFEILKDIISRRIKNINSETGNFSGNVNIDGKLAVRGEVNIDDSDITNVGSIAFPSGGASGIDMGTTTVTQLTSTVTDVTIDSQSGVITTFTSTLAAVTSIVFTVNNTNVLATSSILLTLQGYTGTWVTNGIPVVTVENILAGSFDIRVTNVHATLALAGVLEVAFLNIY